MNSTAPPDATHEHDIKRLLDDWGLWRDTCRWPELRAAYAPGATMMTTWFNGAANDFVDASIKASASGTLVQHFMGPSTIQLHGLKALAETRFILLVRGRLDGVEVDITCYGRFFDKLVRRDGTWRILARVPIYEKDSIATPVPGKPLALDPARLQSHPAGFRHLAYLQSSGGATITPNIPAHNSDAQCALYEAGHAWLDAA